MHIYIHPELGSKMDLLNPSSVGKESRSAFGGAPRETWKGYLRWHHRYQLWLQLVFSGTSMEPVGGGFYDGPHPTLMRNFV